MFHQLRSFVQVRSGRPAGHGKKSRRSSFCPCIENLEDRLVPAVYYPSPSAADGTTGGLMVITAPAAAPQEARHSLQRGKSPKENMP